MFAVILRQNGSSGGFGEGGRGRRGAKTFQGYSRVWLVILPRSADDVGGGSAKNARNIDRGVQHHHLS